MFRIRRRALAAVFLIIAALAVPASAQLRVPPAPSRWATDEAGLLSPRTLEALDARLEDFERRTGHQVLVYIGRTIGGGATLEEWAVKAFEAWRVGRRGLDDGLVLFIFAEDRRIRIEVGYGLEEKVPDARAFRIIETILVPGLRAGRPDEAVTEAVAALLASISGEAPPEGEAARRPGSAVNTIFVIIAGLVFLVIFITNPSLALWLLINILSGGRGGGGGWGGGGGGGGFHGGGGRSGGGGASGRW